MSINVDGSNTRSRSIAAASPCIIVDEWYVDTGRSGSIHDTLYVIRIESLAIYPLTVLVFWLIQDDRATIRNLCIRDYLGCAL
jgi:hypothetical protein